MNSLTNNPENVGIHFDPLLMLKARELSIKLVQSCAKKIKPGMSEEEAHQILKNDLLEFGSEKLWHPSKIRFAQNTQKSFSEKSEPNITLKEGDLFFFDIGPVFNNHEGDYGETFVCGNGDTSIIEHCQNIFKKTAKVWKEDKLSGEKLYQFVRDEAAKVGLVMNEDMTGHRLGDFPHALHHKGSLDQHPSYPKEGLWILELHLLDPKLKQGVFFEDLLL